MSRITIVAFALLLVVACGGSSDTDATVDGQPWSPLPDSPLSQREGAGAFWTGTEVIVLGGVDGPLLDPESEATSEPVAAGRDGAAFDPATGKWRRIADSPVQLRYPVGAVLNGIVYVLVDCHYLVDGAREAFLAYDIAKDSWQELPRPWLDYQPGGLVAAGEILVFGRIFFDPAVGSWDVLMPANPFGTDFHVGSRSGLARS